jgi:hypothetical protein
VLTPAGDVAGVDASTLYENLHVDDYYVKAEAVDAGDTVIYDGEATMYLTRDIVNLMTIILNQSAVSVEGNAAPRINAVAVTGRTIPIGDMDPSFLPAGADTNPLLYVPAIDEGESVTVQILATDIDADPLQILYFVTDSADQATGVPQGTVTPLTPSSFSWTYNVEGTYWATIIVSDGNGGVAVFQFNLYVWRGEGNLQVELEFNTFPTIAIDAMIVYGHQKDLSDTTISLAGSTADPDGDPVASTLWTEDCMGAFIASDPTSLNAVVIPVIEEVCTASLTSCDSRGCNMAQLTMDISCTTLGNGFDPYAAGAVPINDCFLAGMCPPDPALHECTVNSWECGLGYDSCGNLEDCEAFFGQTCEEVYGALWTCGTPMGPDENTCYPCSDDRTDLQVCADAGGLICETTQDICQVDRDCGTCDIGFTCVDGLVCEPPYTYSCSYYNIYSSGDECMEYYGDWTLQEVTDDCTGLYSYLDETNTVIGAVLCDVMTDCNGTCTAPRSEGRSVKTRFYGDIPMGLTEQFCEDPEYGNGIFEVGCEGFGGIDPGDGYTLEQAALDAMVSNADVTVTEANINGNLGITDCVLNAQDQPDPDNPCEQVMAKATPFEWFEYTPTAAAPDTAYVFYPGADLDVRAYAPPAQDIANLGHLVVLMPMPGGAAILGEDRITSVMAAHPEISNWFLGGHSMGGAAAISYEYKVLNGDIVPPEPLTGVIVWAGYGTDEFPIQTTATPVTVIYEYAKETNKVAGEPYLPATAVYIRLEGVNHANFGYYGIQDGDYPAKITKENQKELSVSSTVHSMNRVKAGGATENPLYETVDSELDALCEQAQQVVANTDPVFDTADLFNQMTDDIGTLGFRGASATLDPAATPPINIVTLPIDGGNPTSLNAPPVYRSQVFCKLKDQESIVRDLPAYAYSGGTANIGTCGQMNEATYNWARGAVGADDPTALADYDASGVTLIFGADYQSATGPDFVYGDQSTLEEISPNVYELRAASIQVAPGEAGNVPEKEEVKYCKLWSPARAVYWILEQK